MSLSWLTCYLCTLRISTWNQAVLLASRTFLAALILTWINFTWLDLTWLDFTPWFTSFCVCLSGLKTALQAGLELGLAVGLDDTACLATSSNWLLLPCPCPIYCSGLAPVALLRMWTLPRLIEDAFLEQFNPQMTDLSPESWPNESSLRVIDQLNLFNVQAVVLPLFLSFFSCCFHSIPLSSFFFPVHSALCSCCSLFLFHLEREGKRGREEFSEKREGKKTQVKWPQRKPDCCCAHRLSAWVDWGKNY